MNVKYKLKKAGSYELMGWNLNQDVLEYHCMNTNIHTLTFGEFDGALSRDKQSYVIHLYQKLILINSHKSICKSNFKY